MWASTHSGEHNCRHVLMLVSIAKLSTLLANYSAKIPSKPHANLPRGVNPAFY